MYYSDTGFCLRKNYGKHMHTGNIPFAVIIHHALNSFIGVVLLDSGSGSKKRLCTLTAMKVDNGEYTKIPR